MSREKSVGSGQSPPGEGSGTGAKFETHLMWKPIFAALEANGLINASKTTRVVIDCEIGMPAKLTVWSFADGRWADVFGVVHKAKTSEEALVR